MAKYERSFLGDFEELLSWVHNDITSAGISASYEDGSSITMGTAKMAVRVYERYSMMGGNRVSLNITVISNDKNIFLTAITAGGSKAVFLKINTFGEEAFLDICKKSVEEYVRRRNPV